MKKFTLFFILLIFFCNAQQLESLKIIKAKHDSIAAALQTDFIKEIKGKSNEEYNKIYLLHISKILKNSNERKANYKMAVEEFLKSQTSSSVSPEAANVPSSTDSVSTPEVFAEYSLGFPKLSQEIYYFIKDNSRASDFNYTTMTAKIHFWVKKDNSLFVEKVEGADALFNDMALLAFLMTKGAWTAGKQRDRFVNCKFILPIKFIVPEE